MFDNHKAADKGVSRMCVLNELDDSLLLVASSKYMTILALSHKPIILL